MNVIKTNFYVCTFFFALILMCVRSLAIFSYDTFSVSDRYHSLKLHNIQRFRMRCENLPHVFPNVQTTYSV